MAKAQGEITLLLHGPGAWRLQLKPGGIGQLQGLFDAHSFWAQGRKPSSLKRMLQGSQAAVSAWHQGRLVGFGRATSDGIYRAVLWDVVVAESHQGQGLGRRLVETLLMAQALSGVERIYLMTTNSSGFYGQLGFEPMGNQQLMLRKGA
jgi:GNAT superfamily N-acetyltransferase